MYPSPEGERETESKLPYPPEGGGYGGKQFWWISFTKLSFSIHRLVLYSCYNTLDLKEDNSMEPRLERSEWYDQSPAAVPAATVQAAPKKSRRGLTITLLSLLAVVVITAGVLGAATARMSGRVRVQSGTGPIAPSITPGSGYEDDFREFFAEYYTPQEETYSGSHLERKAGDPGAGVQIISAEGREELTLQELYRQSVDSIVGIEAYREGSSGYAWGTGVVMSEDGYIVTNEHVIDEAKRANVVLADGREFDAVLIGEDTQTDLAVLKIDAEGLIAAEFGDSAALSVGDHVVAIGNPLGDTLTGTMTDGIVSAINRDIQMSGHRMTLIQTNAALNEGNSGGPLFNMFGQVVGITNMKMVNRYSDVTVEGIGFAIPSATVKSVTDQLIAKGQVNGRPGLGITVGTIPDNAAEHYELPSGLYISAVSEDSDAKDKDVRVGDILTHVNGQPVTKTSEVLAIRDTCAVGDTMTLTIWREGESFDVEIVLRDLNHLY